MRLLGGLTPRAFMRGHWQKRPLFVPAALPRFPGVVDARALAALARRDDVESRIVERRGARWETQHGPFARVAYPVTNFTLLVSGLNLHLKEADALLRRFAFIPQARLDDVMVSYALPGGGVGPHVDSYDVFLLQGPGRRRWKVWDLNDRVTIHECGPGDLLYLPPGWRHDGVALEACFTYSIGFRAPRGAELAAAFLDYLHERGLPDATYRDPGRLPARRAAAIPADMEAFAEASLRRIRWGRDDVRRFLGEYLTMPKPHVVYRAAATRRRLEASMVRLDPATQLLYSGRRFFMNGEAVTVAPADAPPLRRLADQRAAPGTALARGGLRGLISEWRRAGFLHYEER